MRKQDIKSSTATPSPVKVSDTEKYTHYGLGNTATLVSSIHDITNSKLHCIVKPYYSPERITRKEYYYELYSYIAYKSIVEYINISQIRYITVHINFTILYNVYDKYSYE